MSEQATKVHEPDYNAAFEAAAIAIQVAGDVDGHGFNFVQRAQVLEHISSETTTRQKKQEVLDQVAVITQDVTFFRAAIKHARSNFLSGAIGLLDKA